MKNSILATTLALLCLNAGAQTNFTENFESGNLSSWAPYGAQTSLDTATPTNKVPTGGSYAARMTNSSCRMYNTSLPTAAYGMTAQSFRFTFYYYDDSGTATRGFCETRDYPGGIFGTTGYGQLLAIGKYNNVTMLGEAYKGTKYQARIVLGAPSGWFNLDAAGSPNRSTGWHRFDIERGANASGEKVLLFYVDTILSRSFTNSNANAAWDSVILGPGLGTTAGNAWFDGLQIVQGQTFISAQPAGTTNFVGQDATLTVSAYGDAGPLSYQWKKSGAAISGATDSSYTITNCQITNSGSYSVVVSNILAVKASDAAYLQVNPLNLITAPPTNQLVNVGNNVTFYAEATGGGTVYYQWNFYGTNIPGATGTGASSTYDITGVTLAQAGPYSVTVTNDLGDPATTSTVATLTVNLPPSLSNATNQTVALNTKVALRMRATDDVSSENTLFQTFDSSAINAHVMFCNATFSGTTGANIDGSQPSTTVVTDTFPDGHGSPRALHARWTWTNTPPGSLRFTTASGGVTSGNSPIISYANRLRFDIYSDRDLKVGLGVRDTNPTSAIGSSDTTGSGQLEWIGVSSSTPSRTVAAGTWTTLDFDPLTDPIQSAYSVGNGVLDSTTGKGALEHLYLMAGDNLPNAYNLYLDNFVVVASKPITFTLESGPDDAAIDPYTGLITWTPTVLGPTNFTVIATDAGTLTVTNTFTLTVVNPAPLVTLVSPANNAAFAAPANVSLAATVTTNGNTIDFVKFFNGATEIGSGLSGNWAGVATGAYGIHAEVGYNGSVTLYSATNHITVLAPVDTFTVAAGAPGYLNFNYSGGWAVHFVLVGTNDVTAPLGTWPVVASTNSQTPATFTIPIGSAANMFYSIRGTP